MKSSNTITVYEHSVLKVGQGINQTQLEALQGYHGEKGVPYYSLIHKGVKFNEFVGVIQVGSTVIEVLPKADKDSPQSDWREMLISMLRAAGIFDVQAPSSSALKVRSNSILDLYFEMFLNEIEYLMHRGLTKKYRKAEGNLKVLKGSLNFAKHLQLNLVHKEHFYVRHSAYDVFHLLHQILFKAIGLIAQINTNTALISKASSMRMWFPEMDDIKVTASTFSRIILNRKTEAYRKALEIAKLLLLNFHPDVSRGRNHVLALMFDMNFLWERFIYASLRKELPKLNSDLTVTPQSTKPFWKRKTGHRTAIRPDIVIRGREQGCFVVDTKWKNLTLLRPSDDDLKQMFVYHEYFEASKVALVYPGTFEHVRGNFFKASGEEGDRECSLLGLKVEGDVRKWQAAIGTAINSWLTEKTKLIGD